MYGKLLWAWHKNQGLVEMGKLVRTLQLKKTKKGTQFCWNVMVSSFHLYNVRGWISCMALRESVLLEFYGIFVDFSPLAIYIFF